MKNNHQNPTTPMTYREFVLAMKRKQLERECDDIEYTDDELGHSRYDWGPS